jgi:hypothetical protein
MYSLLPILLLVLTIVVLVKHYNQNMKLGEKLILVMIFFLIAYTCYTYMKLEGFSDYKQEISKINNLKNNKKNNSKSKNNMFNEEDDDIEIEDADIENEMDDDFKDVNEKKVADMKNEAVFAQMGAPGDLNNYLQKTQKFEDTPATTEDSKNESGLASYFNPSIVIGRRDGRVQAYDSDFYGRYSNGNGNDNVASYDVDYSSKRDETDRYNVPDYNIPPSSSSNNSPRQYNPDSGINRQYRESGFPYSGTDYVYGSDESAKNNKDGKGLDGRPALVFPKSKLYYPGFQYVDPVRWDVPQRRPGNCIPSRETYPPAGVVETNFSFLEYNQMGKIADKENEVKETNIGSIMPNFVYKVLPYATP